MASTINPPDPRLILDTVAARYGQPLFCFFFGSHAFGRGDAGSDVDVIVVLSRVANPYRETFRSDGFLFDAHVYDPETLHFAMRSEQKTGFAILTGKVDQAVVLPEPSELASKLKEVARQVIASGPAPPPNWDRPRRVLSAALSDVERCADADEQRLMAMDLYVKVMDLFLRSHGQFSGQGRYLVRAVKTFDPVFFDRARTALDRVFQNDAVSPLIELAREVLDLIGGPLTAGYRQDYPEKLRLPLP
jgi:predicted nucleotidyltransferase